MKRTALSIVRDALARRGGFGMDASDEQKQKKPWTVEQTSDDEVTYKFKIHVNKKKFKPVSKELAEQTGVAGNGAEGKSEEDEENGDRGGTGQDSAFWVVMDSPSAAVNAARRQCAATIEQCRARNKFACPYHGAQAVKADLIDRLTAAGVNSVPEVEAVLNNHGKPTGTYSISIPCVNTPDQRRNMERVINEFLRSPGIDQQSTGEGAENDYDDEDEMYNSLFDVDGLNAEARNEEEAHEEREDEPQTEQPAEQPQQEERAEEPEQPEQPQAETPHDTPQETRSDTQAEPEARTEPQQERPQEQTPEPEQAQGGEGETYTVTGADGQPINVKMDWDIGEMDETFGFTIAAGTGYRGLPGADIGTIDTECAGINNMLGAEFNIRDATFRELSAANDALLRDDKRGFVDAIARHLKPLGADGQAEQGQEQTQGGQQGGGMAQMHSALPGEHGSVRIQNAQPAQSEETPRQTNAPSRQTETQASTQAQTPSQPIPTTPFSDMAKEAFTRAKNAAFAAGADDRVAQARGRALSSVLGRANGIAGGHTMAEIHDRLHSMMGEAAMRNDRDSVNGYQQALDMIGNEGGFTPHPFDVNSVRAPEIDYNAIEHGEGDNISQSEIDAIKTGAKGANLDAFKVGHGDSSRSPEVARAHALAHFLSRNGGLQSPGGITLSQLKDRMRARLREKANDETAAEGTRDAIVTIGRILGRGGDAAGFGLLADVDNGNRGRQTQSATQQSQQSAQTRTEAQATRPQSQASPAPRPTASETPAPQTRTQTPSAATATPTPQPAQATSQPPPPPPRPAQPRQPQTQAQQPQARQQASETPRQGNNGFTGRRAQAAAQRLEEAARRAGSARVRSILERIRDNARRLGGQGQN